MTGKNDQKDKCVHQRWAEFRFGVVGRLLAAPPEKGGLNQEYKILSEQTWKHPITGTPTQFGKSTIQRWYLTAIMNERHSPVDVLRRKVRGDAGSHPGLPEPVRGILRTQFERYPYWSYQLHYDNLRTTLEGMPLIKVPSYNTMKRYMQHLGLMKRKRPRRRDDGTVTPGAEQAELRLEKREVRSFEREHVGALWHLDFHFCSRKVLVEDGKWATPIALGIVDDHSRLLCHLQWYLAETAENLCHGVIQAIMRRGLPRELMTDNGAAMISEEFTEGLMRLGISHERTLPYSPYQNGKQEVFWGRIEGRLIAMLDQCKTLNLKKLNDLTFAWAEHEYNALRHEETTEIPSERYAKGKSVLRISPDLNHLRGAFRREELRTQRRGDGTVMIESRRFEVPAQFRYLKVLKLRYAKWDLSFVTMLDPRTGLDLCRLYPQDKAKNASGMRRTLAAYSDIEANKTREPAPELPPLLEKLLREQEKTGFPPTYLPKLSEQNVPNSNLI